MVFHVITAGELSLLSTATCQAKAFVEGLPTLFNIAQCDNLPLFPLVFDFSFLMILPKVSVLAFLAVVQASQPSAPEPVAAPLRDLPLGQLNFLHTTDTHGWHAGHLQEYASDPLQLDN